MIVTIGAKTRDVIKVASNVVSRVHWPGDACGFPPLVFIIVEHLLFTASSTACDTRSHTLLLAIWEHPSEIIILPTPVRGHYQHPTILVHICPTSINMSVVSLLSVEVKNNPATFNAPYEFEITFECLEQLQKGKPSYSVLL